MLRGGGQSSIVMLQENSNARMVSNIENLRVFGFECIRETRFLVYSILGTFEVVDDSKTQTWMKISSISLRTGHSEITVKDT